ncbi:MAG: DUF4337 domain-containing protein [Bradyrhizobium sp.]|nr:DUF4337 domain-containing protein [Bradyrhizobium sp.]
MEGLEVHEHIEHAGHGDSHAVGVNRRLALLIAVLAAALAIAEAAGKAAQTEALSAKVEASDLWAFYQAKTIRQTTVRTAAEAARLELAAPDLAPERRAAVQRQVDAWEQTAARYESDPASREGRKELTERAKEAEAVRDRAAAAYHHFEFGSAGFQLAIVLASASAITGALALAYAAGGLGVIAAAVTLLAWLAPAALHL